MSRSSRPGGVLAVCFALVSVGLSAPQTRAAGTTPLSAQVLFRLPAISSVSISPGGEWVIGVAQYERTWGIFAERRGQGIPVPVYTANEPITRIAWVGRDSLFVRLLPGHTGNTHVIRLRFENGEILQDGMDLMSTGWLVDPLPDEDEIVLWADRWGTAHEVRRGPVSALASNMLWKESGRWKTGTLEPVASLSGSGWVLHWVTDRNHVVRAALGVEGRWHPHYALFYRRGADDSWHKVWQGKPDDPQVTLPVGITRDDQRIVVLAYGDHDTRGLSELDPESGALVREIYRQPDVDLAGVLFDYDGIGIIAVAYDEGGERHYHYFDEFRDRYLPDAAKLAPGEHVAVVSSSRDHRFLALAVQSAREPGSFYFLDRTPGPEKRRRLVPLGRVNEAVRPEQLVPVETLEVVSPDGTKVEAYLARPERSDGKPPPLVVLPHGGPIDVRDYGGLFDPLTQYLATAGLAVLRVNYRGSAGFGRSFLEAGAKQWGRGIEDDVDAAVDAVIARDEVDPHRMCIAGGSYGGYSALMSAIRRPDRYRCVATVNGVTDLPLTIWDARDLSFGSKYLDRYVGDPRAEFDRLMEVSPVYHVEELRAPVMIIQGSADTTVDPEQAYRLRAMLEVHDKPYEWLEVSKMHHSPNTAEWRVIAFALKWFLQCHLGEIDPPGSRTWHGHVCQPVPHG